MKNNIVIIGKGRIGKHLHDRLESMGVNAFYLDRRKSNGGKAFKQWMKTKPRAVFLAIPTHDRGEMARDHILTFAKEGVPVITCEKGSLSFYPDLLRGYPAKIGFSAALGGGTRMLRYLKDRHLCGKQIEILAVVNGTLNFIFDGMLRRGQTLDEACEEAISLGYAESGAADSLALINGELRDIVMKACLLFNVVLAKERFITPNRIVPLELTAHNLKKLCEIGRDHRFVVSFSNRGFVKAQPGFGKQFTSNFTDRDSWHINGAFRQITPTSGLASWLPEGVGNAVRIIEGENGSGGTYTLSGPGAGVEPTVSAMLADFEELCG